MFIGKVEKHPEEKTIEGKLSQTHSESTRSLFEDSVVHNVYDNDDNSHTHTRIQVCVQVESMIRGVLDLQEMLRKLEAKGDTKLYNHTRRTLHSVISQYMRDRDSRAFIQTISTQIRGGLEVEYTTLQNWHVNSTFHGSGYETPNKLEIVLSGVEENLVAELAQVNVSVAHNNAEPRTEAQAEVDTKESIIFRRDETQVQILEVLLKVEDQLLALKSADAHELPSANDNIGKLSLPLCVKPLVWIPFLDIIKMDDENGVQTSALIVGRGQVDWFSKDQFGDYQVCNEALLGQIREITMVVNEVVQNTLTSVASVGLLQLAVCQVLVLWTKIQQKPEVADTISGEVFRQQKGTNNIDVHSSATPDINRQADTTPLKEQPLGQNDGENIANQEEHGNLDEFADRRIAPDEKGEGEGNEPGGDDGSTASDQDEEEKLDSFIRLTMQLNQLLPAASGEPGDVRLMQYAKKSDLNLVFEVWIIVGSEGAKPTASQIEEILTSAERCGDKVDSTVEDLEYGEWCESGANQRESARIRRESDANQTRIRVTNWPG